MKRRKEKQNEKLNTINAMINALDNTGVRMFMYYPQDKTITVPEKTCEVYQCEPFYENMPHSFANDYVYENDYNKFKEMYYKIDRGEKTATATFHSKDLKYRNHVTLTTVSWTDDGKPKDVFGIVENFSDLYQSEKLVCALQEKLDIKSDNAEIEDAMKNIAMAIGSQYFAVYYIWLESRKYICFQEKLEGILDIIGEKGDYEPAWEQYINNYISSQDQDKMRDFVEINSLADRIGNKGSISQIYHRKEVGWTRGKFIVGKRDEYGKPLTVIYTVSNINEEMEAKQQKALAEKEALQDALTGLWNRKAFDQFKEDKEYKDKPTGLILFDIDRFKGVNDQYGHSEGDRVIKTIAQETLGTLRHTDTLFRFGGDEFAILLYNCDTPIWDSVCRKIESIHFSVKKSLGYESAVTVSAGVCVNENGYCDKMFELADKAMYHTKANGRGGCTSINIDGSIAKEWHDNSSFLRKGDVLEKNSTVTWRVDKPKNDKVQFRAYGDEMFSAYVGLNSSATPEELFQAWKNRVQPDNLELLTEATNLAIDDGKVEVIFNWNHPEKGLIQLRCSASLESENDDYYSFIGYIHIITGTHVITIEDIDSKIKNALEEMYFCNFYIRLKDYTYTIHKALPHVIELFENYKDAQEAAKAYVENMVLDKSKIKMAEFLDLSTLADRMDNTNVLKNQYFDVNIGLVKAKFIAVDRDESGKLLTVALIVESSLS